MLSAFIEGSYIKTAQRHYIGDKLKRAVKVVQRYWHLEKIEPPETHNEAFIERCFDGTATSNVDMPPAWLLVHPDALDILDIKIRATRTENKIIGPISGRVFKMGFDWEDLVK